LKGKVGSGTRGFPSSFIRAKRSTRRIGRLRSQEASVPTLPFNLKFNALGEPEADAADVLHKLGKYYYNVLYLYRDPGASFVEAREWLRKHKFPVGLTKAIKPGPEALTGLIEELKEGGWDNVNAGIGRAPDFAEVLVKNRIKVVILPEGDQDVEFPRRAQIVKNWKEVRRHL